LDDLKERRGHTELKEEALDRTLWRARFGRGFGPVVRQTTKLMMCLSVRPSVRISSWKNSAPTERIVMKRVLSIFIKSLRKFKIH
jgi:hypothetical protein